MTEWELTEGEIAKAIKESRRDTDRTYARYRAVGKAAQNKLLDWQIRNGFIDTDRAKKLQSNPKA